MNAYYFETKVGVFSIVNREGRWHVMLDDESLGSYANERLAADDVAGGHTFSAGHGIDTAKLGIGRTFFLFKTGLLG